jgi:hypothetical protein
MRKLSLKQKQYQIRKQKKLRKRQRFAVIKRKKLKLLITLYKRHNPVSFTVDQIRNELKRCLYKTKNWNLNTNIVIINCEFGLEDINAVDYFLDTAASFIDFNSSVLQFDLTKCNRVWPSGITLLCSLMQWVELTSSKNHRPKISSSNSNNNRVNSYLSHSGFYDYVARPKDTDVSYYSDDEIVKIRRETNKSNIEKREKSIVDLLQKYSTLTPEELEWFDSVILTEAFNNVSEHGVSNKDNGWWLLAQRHPSHKIISLSIADNGIGIRHSLMTGPQRIEIGNKIENIPKNDGEFIKLALEENVRGAIAASIKTGKFLKRYESGARRGNGLKRIRKTCSDLKISFSILSHYGYVFVNQQGKIVKIGSKNSRVFSGTMYHFIIGSK